MSATWWLVELEFPVFYCRRTCRIEGALLGSLVVHQAHACRC